MKLNISKLNFVYREDVVEVTLNFKIEKREQNQCDSSFFFLFRSSSILDPNQKRSNNSVYIEDVVEVTLNFKIEKQEPNQCNSTFFSFFDQIQFKTQIRKDRTTFYLV